MVVSAEAAGDVDMCSLFGVSEAADKTAQQKLQEYEDKLLDSFRKMKEKFNYQFPGIKVVILSSSIDPVEKKQAEENQNVIAFLNKPLTLDMINELKHHPELKGNFDSV